ncbi:SDR family NAD(P)-dependent oxidoreductase [Novosphingobium malaysiense]|uniref:SDR family NAD(P)-dependent oxidoreductase n=1 Tax=Novosphingobium malaysiense TaxID=1348853 RepID=UPI0018CFB03B|nr:SDR family oxidoreductase [Novosphingobium malaysiense]
MAIVTGGAKGVGLGIASVLAEAGASVVIMSRTQADIDNAIVRLDAFGGQSLGVVGDVTKFEDNERLVQQALETFGRVDILVNNAGGALPVPFEQISTQQFHDDFHFNVVQAFQLTQLVVPHMRETGDGSIINISSLAARYGADDMLTYSVTKAGLEQMTRVCAQEFAPEIRVNCIALGMTMTDALEGYISTVEGALANVLPQIPLNRIGNVEDVGLAALYLCSAGCYVTGKVIDIDGGILRSVRLGG